MVKVIEFIFTDKEDRDAWKAKFGGDEPPPPPTVGPDLHSAPGHPHYVMTPSSPRASPPWAAKSNREVFLL